MQTNTTITTTDATNATDETTNTKPTLADLISAYRAKVRQAEIQARLDALEANTEEYERFQQSLITALPADLFDALNLSFRWNGDPFTQYGDGHPEAAFSFDGEEWKLYRDDEGEWHIHAPADRIYRRCIFWRDLAETLVRTLANYEDLAPHLRQEQQEQPEQCAPTSADYPDMTSDEIPF